MPTIHDMSAGPPKRLAIRIAVALGFAVIAFLYVEHRRAREMAQHDAAASVLNRVAHGAAGAALTDAVVAAKDYGMSPELARATWAALMADGGKPLLRRTFAYTPHDPEFRLMFSGDGRFLAAIDGNSIAVWNTEDGKHVLTTEAGDRFVGYWRIGARHFGLLASYQYFDLVNSVIELPDDFRYAQASKDALTAVAPGGDWAYRVPDRAQGRSDYPIKLINLHTGEKREVDVRYNGYGPVAVNADASRIANQIQWRGYAAVGLWDARSRTQIGNSQCGGAKLYFSHALRGLIGVNAIPPGSGMKGSLCAADSDSGKILFSRTGEEQGLLAVADDPKGLWFATAGGGAVQLYRGVNSPVLSIIAEKEVSRVPATSR